MSNINKNRTKHLNRLKEYNKKYHAENPNKAREKRRKRRALIKNNNHQSYTEEQVLEVYGTNCYLCDMPIDLNNSRRIGISGWKTGLHIEHLIPLSNNGSDSIDNVRPSHGWCNISKGAKSV
jgi:5-methylcytosine-specific restriction endonuclease McrA